jgi:defect-in-organelle-trafficking protein DotD
MLKVIVRVFFPAFAGSLMALMLASCASASRNLNDIETQNASIQLAEASTSVSNTLTDLGSITRAVTPALAMHRLPDPNSYGMNQQASVDWSGPVEPLVRQIANASRYRLQVLGNAPAIPVLISVHQKNSTLGYLLRDIDFQCATKANIVVFPSQRVIELRYARS